jgi:hypothetical protein
MGFTHSCTIISLIIACISTTVFSMDIGLQGVDAFVSNNNVPLTGKIVPLHSVELLYVDVYEATDIKALIPDDNMPTEDDVLADMNDNMPTDDDVLADMNDNMPDDVLADMNDNMPTDDDVLADMNDNMPDDVLADMNDNMPTDDDVLTNMNDNMPTDDDVLADMVDTISMDKLREQYTDNMKTNTIKDAHIVGMMDYPPSKRTLTFTMTVPMKPNDSLDDQWDIFQDALTRKFSIDTSTVVIISVTQSSLRLIRAHTLQVVAAITLPDRAITHITEQMSHGQTELTLMGVITWLDVTHVTLSPEQRE